MNIIVAADKNWGIGKKNELLVSIPADMKMFREETTGKVVVMGRKTLESFPNGLPLKNRTNIVITGNKELSGKRCGDRSQHRRSAERSGRNIRQRMCTVSAETVFTDRCFRTVM